jgi:hypothetical protein
MRPLRVQRMRQWGLNSFITQSLEIKLHFKTKKYFLPKHSEPKLYYQKHIKSKTLLQWMSAPQPMQDRGTKKIVNKSFKQPVLADKLKLQLQNHLDVAKEELNSSVLKEMGNKSVKCIISPFIT